MIHIWWTCRLATIKRAYHHVASLQVLAFVCTKWLIIMMWATPQKPPASDSFIHICDMTISDMRHDPFICTFPQKAPAGCGMTSAYTWHDSFKCVTWPLHMCDMTTSFIHVTWLFLIWDTTPSHVPRRRCLLCVIWLLHTCDMTPSYMWYDSFICVTWLLCIRYMIPCPYVWHDSFWYVTWLLHMCDMPPSYVWHDSFICETWLLHMFPPLRCAYVWCVSFIYMKEMTPSYMT